MYVPEIWPTKVNFAFTFSKVSGRDKIRIKCKVGRKQIKK